MVFCKETINYLDILVEKSELFSVIWSIANYIIIVGLLESNNFYRKKFYWTFT